MPPSIATSIEAGSGPMRRAVRRQQPVEVAAHDARLGLDPGPVVEDARLAEGGAELDEHVVGDRLSGEGRSRRPEGEVAPLAPGPTRRAPAPRPCRADARSPRGSGGRSRRRRSGPGGRSAASAPVPARGCARGRPPSPGRPGAAPASSRGGLRDRDLEAVAGAAGVERDRGGLLRRQPVARHARGVRDQHAARREERARRSCAGAPRRPGSAFRPASGCAPGSAPGRLRPAAPSARPRRRRRSAR